MTYTEDELTLMWIRYVEEREKCSNSQWSGMWKMGSFSCGSVRRKTEHGVIIIRGTVTTSTLSLSLSIHLPCQEPIHLKDIFLPTILFNLLETVISPLLLVSLSHSYSSYSPTRLDSLPIPSPLPPHSLLTPSPSLHLSLHTRDLICATGGNLP